MEKISLLKASIVHNRDRVQRGHSSENILVLMGRLNREWYDWNTSKCHDNETLIVLWLKIVPNKPEHYTGLVTLIHSTLHVTINDLLSISKGHSPKSRNLWTVSWTSAPVKPNNYKWSKLHARNKPDTATEWTGHRTLCSALCGRLQQQWNCSLILSCFFILSFYALVNVNIKSPSPG